MEAIGRRLSLTRQVTGLTQKDFSGRAKIARNTYNQYEKGKRVPRLDHAIALAETFELTLDWVYLGDPSGLRYQMADAIKALAQARR